MNCGPLSLISFGLTRELLQRPLHDQLHVRLLHRLADLPLHDVTAEPVEHAAQVVERASQVQVGHVDMPLLMRLFGLHEARALLRRRRRALRQNPRVLQHAIHRRGRARHDVGVDHHVRQAPIPVARMLDEEVDRRLLLPLLQPPVARDVSVVLVGAAVPLPPVVKLRAREAEPFQQPRRLDLRPFVQPVHEIDDLVAGVELGPRLPQLRPSFF